MPIIKMGYGYGLVGLGAAGAAPGVVTPPARSTPGFMDGLKLWTTPANIWQTVKNFPDMISLFPMVALGFAVPALVLGFLLLGGAGGAGYVAGRRRARRAANPSRRVYKKAVKRTMWRGMVGDLARLRKRYASSRPGKRSRSRGTYRR